MIKEYLEKNKNKMIEDLSKLVSYNSVYCNDAKPFGQANKDVLDTTLQIMSGIGLKTENLDHYCGYGQMGEGEKTIGILAHLDIVPAGEGWDSDPFTLTIKDDVMYGRGVADDKGAVIASIYALKYLKETNYPLKKKVRLIVGCNEETGSECVRYYVKKEGHIDMGFTPDGNFPGIFAEKGMIGGYISSCNTKIIKITGGEASNVVCKKVTVELPCDSYDESILNEFFRDNDIEYTLIKSNESIQMTIFGKAAHASTPDLGINAINYLMEGLYVAGFDDELVSYFHDKISLSNHGEIIGADRFNDQYTDLSMCIGKVSKSDSEVRFSVDIRFPVTADLDEVSAYICEKLTLGNNHFILESPVAPLFFDQDSKMIKALLKAYQDVTGDKQRMMEAIGGGTYAKSIDNCIAFGCEFPGEENHIHDANECLKIDSLLKQVEIYIEAIKNLNEV